jgi:acyl-CoA reductase-like NAD-dependent aldehyde dehydrogenase
MKKELEIFSPYNQKLIRTIPLQGFDEKEQALARAHHLFNNKSKWIPAWQRVEILEKTAKLLSERIEDFTMIAAEEGGKPYMDSKVEVLRAINGVKLAAEEIGRIKGEQIPMGHNTSSINRLAFTIREPIGVVVSISAFNHPLNLIVHQTATALAAGCPVIIKPALTTPLSCIAFLDLLKESGLPGDWCQVLICEDEIAEQLATDPRINYLSFIGSAKVGWYLRSKLAPGTRCAMEHGGVAPVLVEADANIEEMLPALVKGGFYHAGQVCVSVQRIFVHHAIVDTVSEKISYQAKQLITGDPLDPKTEVGPLILPKEVDRIEEWVTEAIKGGATVLCGGKRISDTCFEPTVLLNPAANAKVSSQEVFGPVVCIYSYNEINEAIEIANSLPFAFQASVYTSRLDAAFDAVNKLNASAVMVNDHTAFRVDWMPYGGRDASGIGTGGIPYSIHEMTREKLMVFKSNAIQ